MVVTVKNDDVGVKTLLADLARQTLQADEVVIIRAEDYQNCNRGKGRNIGIERAKNEIIAVTDVGCRPHPDWLEKLIFPLLNKEADVASGFYQTIANTNLQKAIAPYLAILPNKWSENYLPASRSIGFTKLAWKKVSGYPEEAESGAEDLEFARRLKDNPNIKIIQVPKALVDWEVPNNLADFMRDMMKHTLGNWEVGYRPHIYRNLTVILRWILFAIWPWLLAVYLIWVLGKLGRLGQLGMSWKILLWLPMVQLIADAAVIATMVIWGLEKLRLAGSAGSAD